MMTRTTTPTSKLLAAAVFVSLLVACVVSPVPQPPNVQPTLDPAGVKGETCTECDTDAIILEGPAGAVEHPDGLDNVFLWIVNLDSEWEPEAFPVNTDGSFTATPRGTVADIFRLQARVGGVENRSDPVDLIMGRDGGIVDKLEHPLGECFFVEPSPELELVNAQLGEFTDMELRNECSEALTIERSELRVPSAAFLVTGAPTTLARGESAVVRVELITDETGPHEAVFLIDVSGPAPDRRAITILALEPAN